MSDRRAFCEGCGAAIGAGASFCEACGRPRRNAAAAPSGGPSQLPSPSGDLAASFSARANRNERRRERRLGIFGRLLFLVLGVLLLVFGLRSPALAVAGTSTSGAIYQIEQKHTRSDGRLRTEYWARYRFSAGGQSATGSYSLGTVHDVGNLPKIGTSVRVRYFAAWPEYNFPENQLAFDWYGFVAAGIGALLLFAAVRNR